MPAELRLEALQAAIVLMVDEHRDVLQSLLLFLSDISQYASEHQVGKHTLDTFKPNKKDGSVGSFYIFFNRSPIYWDDGV